MFRSVGDEVEKVDTTDGKDYFDDEIVRAEILPKTRTVYEQGPML